MVHCLEILTSVTKKYLKHYFLSLLQTWSVTPFSGGGGGNWMWKQMKNNMIPSSTVTTLGTTSRTIKLFSNFSVKDGGSFREKGSTKGNLVLYWRGYKARNIGLDDGYTNRALTVAGYLQSAGGELSNLEVLFVCFVLFCILATKISRLKKCTEDLTETIGAYERIGLLKIRATAVYINWRKDGVSYLGSYFLLFSMKVARGQARGSRGKA